MRRWIGHQLAQRIIIPLMEYIGFVAVPEDELRRLYEIEADVMSKDGEHSRVQTEQLKPHSPMCDYTSAPMHARWLSAERLSH